MKKSGSILFILGLCACLIIGGSIGTAASQFFTIEVSPVNVKTNGEEFKPLAADGEPLQLFAYEGVTYVPLRALAELYGLQVGYDAASNSALVSSAEYKEIADAELSIRQELPLHSFGVMEPCRIHYIDAATLLLCYYYSIPGAAPESLLVRYDLTNGTATELFRGELSDSYFFDVSIYQYGRNHYIQAASANKNILHYDAEAKKLNIIDAAEANRFTVLLENGKYLVCRDGKLFLTEEVGKQGADIYEIDRDIIAYDIAPRSSAFAGIDYSGAITTVDFETGKVSTIIPDSVPEGLVDYQALHYSHYAADEEYFIIDASCENGNVIQVVDMAGKVIAEYASQGRECRLLQICDDKLLIADGEKLQGYVVAWEYESDTTEILFDSSEQYTDPVYISDAKLHASGETLSVLIQDQGEAKLLQIACRLNEQTLFGKAAAFLNEEFHNAYDPYYDIQGLTISNWQEDGDEATFFLKMSYLYYNRDPDTVKYIQDAKEYSQSSYETLYNDYLALKEANYEFKVVLKGEYGEILELYSNVSPIGTEWQPVKITDFILK